MGSNGVALDVSVATPGWRSTFLSQFSGRIHCPLLTGSGIVLGSHDRRAVAEHAGGVLDAESLTYFCGFGFAKLIG